MSISAIKAQDYNPDILNTLANLSSDEVFTPPEVANQVLDLLPQELFSSPETTFLDPATKSGIFLREIARRLMEGLREVFPDEQERRDHIFHHQLYGNAITELTSLMSRRSLYCSKFPNGRYSVSKFQNAEGNIRFKQQEHRFVDGRCAFCGASEGQFGKKVREGLEYHAYEFIHTLKPEEIFGMKFDVIIGNPPYQISTAGSVESQATPIYHKFVQQAKRLNPQYICMITPSRWMNGGFGLDTFRNEMLNDKHIRCLHDYLNASDCFPGISLAGGVSYFLWERKSEGKCRVFTHRESGITTQSERYLLEPGLETFIRFNEGVGVLEKIAAHKQRSFVEIVSQRDPFGLNYFEGGRERMFKLFHPERQPGDLSIYSFGWRRDGMRYVQPHFVTTNAEAIRKYKVFVSKANGAASSTYPYAVISKPFVGQPNTVCNMTYLMVGPFAKESEAINTTNYMMTKFARFLISLLKNTQNAYKKVYSFVPLQDFSKPWTDAELYAKYGLTEEEIAFIESMIRPMDAEGGEQDG
ncbi:MAG: Eco57I restriction-modification methylase domain-containing protein [Christensenellales bacterium]